MANKPVPGADQVFSASQQRDETIKDIIAKERAAVEAKTARLRALRLAKEAADREAAASAPPPAAKPRTRRKKA
jgi:hypothetical protein